jgi:hypothetical protein
MNFVEEEMPDVIPTILELFLGDQDMFISLIKERKNTNLFDISKSLEENHTKALDMISFIIKNYPKSITEREAYKILMTVMVNDNKVYLSNDIISKLEMKIKNPRWKMEIIDSKKNLCM